MGASVALDDGSPIGGSIDDQGLVEQDAPEWPP